MAFNTKKSPTERLIAGWQDQKKRRLIKITRKGKRTLNAVSECWDHVQKTTTSVFRQQVLSSIHKLHSKPIYISVSFKFPNPVPGQPTIREGIKEIKFFTSYISSWGYKNGSVHVCVCLGFADLLCATPQQCRATSWPCGPPSCIVHHHKAASGIHKEHAHGAQCNVVSLSVCLGCSSASAVHSGRSFFIFFPAQLLIPSLWEYWYCLTSYQLLNSNSISGLQTITWLLIIMEGIHKYKEYHLEDAVVSITQIRGYVCILIMTNKKWRAEPCVLSRTWGFQIFLAFAINFQHFRQNYQICGSSI